MTLQKTNKSPSFRVWSIYISTKSLSQSVLSDNEWFKVHRIKFVKSLGSFICINSLLFSGNKSEIQKRKWSRQMRKKRRQQMECLRRIDVASHYHPTSQAHYIYFRTVSTQPQFYIQLVFEPGRRGTGGRPGVKIMASKFRSSKGSGIKRLESNMHSFVWSVLATPGGKKMSTSEQILRMVFYGQFFLKYCFVRTKKLHDIKTGYHSNF